MWRAPHSGADCVRDSSDRSGSMRIELAVLPMLALSVAAVSMDQGNTRLFNDAVSTEDSKLHVFENKLFKKIFGHDQG